MATLTALVLHRPEFAVVILFPAAVAAHAFVRGLRQRIRVHVLRWTDVGRLVESDLSTPRAIAVQIAFLLTLAAKLSPAGGGWPFAAALVALAAASGWAALPIVREATRELVELVTDAATPIELGPANP